MPKVGGGAIQVQVTSALIVGLSWCCTYDAVATPPRYKATLVPGLDMEDSRSCCTAEVFGFGPGDTVLGRAFVSNPDGTRGFSWRSGDEPVDLTGDNFMSASTHFMNQAGWIAGWGVNCSPTSGCVEELFFVSPQGELVDLRLEGYEFDIDGLTDDSTMVYRRGWSEKQGVLTVDSDGILGALPLPPESYSPRVIGLSRDGSVIGGWAWGVGGGALRWVDGQVEQLSVGTGVSATLVAVGGDGSIVGTVWDGKKGNVGLGAARWNVAGELSYLPEPEGATSCTPAYADEEIVAGSAVIDGVYNVVLWSLENDQATLRQVIEIGPSQLDSFGITPPVRAGDVVAFLGVDIPSKSSWLLFIPITGGDAVWFEDAMVLGDLRGPIGHAAGPGRVFTTPGSDSMALNIEYQSEEPLPYLLERLRPGDVNGDSLVDGADLAEILGAWDRAARAADLNLDGVVDGADLTIALGDWG